jgi:plasmid maintenance system killer protein
MIVSFRSADTEDLANGRRVPRIASIEAVARRKLRQLQIAGRLPNSEFRGHPTYLLTIVEREIKCEAWLVWRALWYRVIRIM